MAIGALTAIVLLGKKRYPLPTLAGCLALTGVLAVMTRRSYPVTPANVVALYAVGRYCCRSYAVVAAVATIAIGFAVAELTRVPDYHLHTVSDLAWVVFAVLTGAWVRTLRIDVLMAEERAARAEHEREEEARRRVAEERLRIARELHDIVGHALMSINVLSSVSARLVDRNPDAGRDALQTISGVSNTALREIRSTLSLLRAGGRPLAAPGRGIDDLCELIEQSRRSGTPVTFREAGMDQDVPAIVGFTVYRIVQESLTNIARHARDVKEVVVTVARTSDHLDVTVTNDGAPAEAADGGGSGLQGMRERVTAIGGRLDTTALSDGGFRVHARLPLREGTA